MCHQPDATRRTRHEVPRLVGKKRCILLFHRTTPVRIRQGVADRGGYRRDPQLSLDGGESHGLRSHPSSHHGMSMTRVPMDDGRVVHLRLDTRAIRWRWRRGRWSLRSRSRRRCRHRATSVHLHRLSIAGRCRRRHRGRAWRSRGHRGCAWRGRRHRGRVWRSRRHRARAWRDRRHRGLARRGRNHWRRCRCTRKTCRERTDRQRWLNHRVRRKQGLQPGLAAAG